MVEIEEKEHDAECNANNVNMDTFIQSPDMTKTPRKKTNVKNERQIFFGQSGRNDKRV